MMNYKPYSPGTLLYKLKVQNVKRTIKVYAVLLELQISLSVLPVFKKTTKFGSVNEIRTTDITSSAREQCLHSYILEMFL
jgi:hypothetical protein